MTKPLKLYILDRFSCLAIKDKDDKMIWNWRSQWFTAYLVSVEKRKWQRQDNSL